jgi:hypothetical protein
MSLKKIIRKNIEDNAVTEPKLANEAVTAEKLGTDFITGLDELTSVAENDNLLISDTSAGVLKKVTKANTTSLATPTFSSVSPDNSQTADGGNITFTITGTGFTTGTNARLFGASGQRLNFDSVTRSSTTSITATIARSSLLLAQSPYGIQVINGEGSAVTAASQISIDTVPIFNTSAGSLGTFTEGESIDVEVSAYDPDSTSAITFELQSGSLPAGLSLVNQSGDSCRITGTASEVSADTTSNFTLRATDSASNTTSRAFSITIEDFSMNGLRFDDGSSDNLSRTLGTPTSQRIFTISAWIKRGELTAHNYIIGQNSTNESYFRINDADQLDFQDRDATFGSSDFGLTSNALLRDVSAWYHVVLSVDTTQATDTNRGKLYINGELQTLSATTYPPQNYDTMMNLSGATQKIGYVFDYFDGYMSEVVFIDGQQLDPSSFGETDSNGVWIPKAYSGSFGTNGFHLDFADSADLGNDVSGNNNDFTENNITSIDKVEDTPQNNYATLNSLTPTINTTHVYTDGNLTAVPTYVSAGGVTIFHTINPLQGKWYYEIKAETSAGSGNAVHTGVVTGTSATNYTSSSTQSGAEFDIYSNNIEKRSEGSSSVISGSSFSSGDIGMIAVDMDNGKIYIGKNGTWLESSNPATGSNPSVSFTVTNDLVFFTSPVTNSGDSNKAKVSMNFGNAPYTISSGNSDANGYGNFEYAVPSGYYALNTKNLAEYG